MQFRTEIPLHESLYKITHNHNIMGFGSCFIDSIGEKLETSKFRIHRNPFGTLFHPLAIETALARILSLTYYTEDEIFKFGELHFSWDHHTSFNRISLNETLNAINSQLEVANDFIQKTDIFLLTFGTSMVYKIKEMDLIVANCHKVPASQFQKTLLTELQLKNSIKNCFNLILDINPKAKIITTISPVRHLKDGFIENNWSKSRLINALHEVSSQFAQVDYFPAYEIMMDDLRDYRFYKEDHIHPNDLAIQYIWEKFSSVYFEEKTLEKIKITQKIISSLAHRPLNPESLAYKEFLFKTKKQIEQAESLFPKNSFHHEKETLEKLIHHVD